MTTDDERLGPGTKVRISEGVYARPFGEEVVLLDFARGEYFGLDVVGAAVWKAVEAVESGVELGAIAASIVSTHDVDLEVALRDIIDLVTDLGHHGLIVIES